MAWNAGPGSPSPADIPGGLRPDTWYGQAGAASGAAGYLGRCGTHPVRQLRGPRGALEKGARRATPSSGFPQPRRRIRLGLS